MIRKLRMGLSRRAGLAFLVATLFLLLLSTILHVEQADQKTRLRTRDLDDNSTVQAGSTIPWAQAVWNGAGLSCAIDVTAQEAAQFMPPGIPVNSIWTAYGSLAAWGWVAELDHDPMVDLSLGYDLRSLNINPGNNRVIRLTQSREVVVNGLIYPPSDGLYRNVYNVENGVIIADNIKSPEKMTNLPRYVDLRRWSDVTFLQWQEMAQGNVQNLNHVFQSYIGNADTEQIMREALGVAEDFDWQTLSPLSAGRTFYPDTDAFEALLYTPNCRGTAWLLIQHKAQLGHKRISSITIFGENWAPALYLKIDPVT